MQGLAFNLKYFPVTVAQDNGAGNMMGETKQGRTQVLLNTSYTERNCQLFKSKGTLGSASKYQSMTPNGLGSDCSYSEGKQYKGTKESELHMVFANNKGQCCNACVATDGCVAASFLTSDKDHSGGFGPQSWEGFGFHISQASASKTTGGISVAQLESHFRERFGDYSKFDQFMDYGVTLFTYDLSPYAEEFKKDNVPFLVAQWEAGQDTWYSLFVLSKASHYVIELTSLRAPTVNSNLPKLEQRMSDEHCKKFKAYGSHPAHVIFPSSINRASSDITKINDVYADIFEAKLTQQINQDGVSRRCYNTGGSSSDLEFPPGPGGMSLDQDVCFTQRTGDEEKDAIFSVSDFEAMMWAEHAGTIGSNANSMVDMYTENHYANPMNSAGMTKLASHFTSNDPYPITKDTRLAYACKQSYIIDPTGWSIQPIGAGASWPKCSWENSIVV